MSYTFAPRSGKLAKVRLGNTVLTGKKWTATPTAHESDTTNFETSGLDDVETNTVGLDIVVEFDWDSALGATPYDAGGLNIAPGAASVFSLKLYINDVTGAFWNVPNAKVLTAPVSAEPKAMVGGSVTFRAKPGWSYPTSNF